MRKHPSGVPVQIHPAGRVICEKLPWLYGVRERLLMSGSPALVVSGEAAFGRLIDVVREPPFDVAIGMCAVLEDPFGNVVCLLDMSKGLRAI